jgi:hypothetical protein
MTHMVENLGPAGMSSDESEVDEKTERKTYRMKRRLWRAKVCKERLILIDSDRNVTNAYGGARPGKPPRERIRVSTISERAPTGYLCKDEYFENGQSEQLTLSIRIKQRSLESQYIGRSKVLVGPR